jgi:hypothetical protein
MKPFSISRAAAITLPARLRKVTFDLAAYPNPTTF